MNRFNTYLQNLGFSEKELPKELGNVFSYKLGSDKVIYFVYTANNEDIFTAHHKFWNNNNINIFIAASSEKTYIINAKQKPDKENPLAKQIAIKSFDYGVNSEGYAE